MFYVPSSAPLRLYVRLHAMIFADDGAAATGLASNFVPCGGTSTFAKATMDRTMDGPRAVLQLTHDGLPGLSFYNHRIGSDASSWEA